MNKKKVLFLYAGGTIGQIPRMEAVGEYEQLVLYPPVSDVEFREVCEPVLKYVEEVDGMQIDFELVTTKDSSNMSSEDWEVLAKRVQKAQETDCYDAVGIAHGTDTLTHSATALAFALHGTNPEKSGLQIPVVFTGAQNSIHTKGGDGVFNLSNLFGVIDECIERGVADVMISFWSRVLLGARAAKVSEKEFDAFRSPAYPDVGTINSLGVTIRTDLLRKKSEASYQMDLAANFDNNVITFELTPGLRPEYVESVISSNDIHALILKSHGEGNVPTEGKYNFIPLIEKLTKTKDLPVMITTKFIGGFVGGAHYEVGQKAIAAGGIPGLDHTSVAIDVKTKWLLGNNICTSTESFNAAMKTSYVGEVTV